MKIQHNGINYDTAAAKYIRELSNNDPWSEAGSILWQTPCGEFFKVVYGHQANEMGFEAMDYQQGYALAGNA